MPNEAAVSDFDGGSLYTFSQDRVGEPGPTGVESTGVDPVFAR